MLNSLWATLLIFLVFIGGVFSYMEGTFRSGQLRAKKIKLYFIYHFGVVVGDLIIIPIAVWLWYDHMHHSLGIWIFWMVVAVAITWFSHRAWWFGCEDHPGYMYPDRHVSKGDHKMWFKDLPISAWIHQFYMFLSLVFIQGYIFSPMPLDVVQKTLWLFLIFVPLGVIEPGVVQGWPLKSKDVKIFSATAVGLWIVVLLVTWAKLRHAGLHMEININM